MTATDQRDIAPVVHRHVARILAPALKSPDALDPDLALAREYGLTSMKMVLLMTGLCEELGVPLSRFTDRDLAAIITTRDLVAALSPTTQEA